MYQGTRVDDCWGWSNCRCHTQRCTDPNLCELQSVLTAASLMRKKIDLGVFFFSLVLQADIFLCENRRELAALSFLTVVFFKTFQIPGWYGVGFLCVMGGEVGLGRSAQVIQTGG